MKVILEKTRVVKQSPIKVGAWHQGSFINDVYAFGPSLQSSPAKYFVRDRQHDKVRVVKGKVYQNSQGVVYFIGKNDG